MNEAVADLGLLLAKVGDGDRLAFRKLYDATSSRLFGAVLRMVRDRGLAEEIVQEAYLRVWRRATSFDPASGQPLTWMISIARNGAIDVLRKRREVLVAPDEDGREFVDTIAAEGDEEARICAADGLRLCLGRLEQASRDCIVLAYSCGYSREELATRFDRPVNTIKTWLHRGLAALKSCLENAS